LYDIIFSSIERITYGKTNIYNQGKFPKGKKSFRKVLTRDILKDICFRITDETGINDNIKIYGG